MKIRVLDYRKEVVEDEYFGTCEMCMYTGSALYEQLKLQHDDGSPYWASLFRWEYGDLWAIVIDNVPRFAAWLQDQDLDQEDYQAPLGYGQLEDLVCAYRDFYENN